MTTNSNKEINTVNSGEIVVSTSECSGCVSVEDYARLMDEYIILRKEYDNLQDNYKKFVREATESIANANKQLMSIINTRS